MASYRLTFKRSVAKDLRGLSRQDVARILERIEALSENPRGPGCERLSGQERCRARQGACRVIYEIADDVLVVVVVKVGHRSEVYRDG